MKINNITPRIFFSARRYLGMRMRVQKNICEVFGVLLAILFSSWLMFHTFSYNSNTHEMRIAFKLWSDFAAHIPLIRSFSMGPNWDRLLHLQTIEYPIFPGEPIRYHFLFDMVVGLLEKAGLRIDWALNIPSIIGFMMLLVTIYLLAKKLFHSTSVGLLSVLFFLFNGSLSFVDFFKKHAPIDILSNRDFPAFAPWGPGDITAFWNLNIYTNQRHLAGALALILCFILTCLYIEHKPFHKQLSWAATWAILVGILPFYHQPTLLIMAIIMLTYFVLFPRLRKFLFATGIWSLVLVVPQLLINHGAGSAVEWYPGYIVHGGELEKLPTIVHMIGRMTIFWWNNLGVHSVLMILGFYFIPRQARKILFPIIPIFIIGNLFKFSAEVSANHKFFNFVMILGQMISAYVLVLLFQKIKYFPRYLIIGVLVVFLTLSGIIDFMAVANDTIGTLRDIPAAEAATWIAKNTPAQARFLNSSLFYHQAGIAGREIFMGWPYFAWSAGYDTYARKKDMKTMFESDDFQAVCDLLRHYHLDYVTYETKDPFSEINFHEALFKKHFQKLYQHEESGITIYKTPDECL